MPGPFHLPPILSPEEAREVAMHHLASRCDPANLAMYGVKREHPGNPAPRPGEIPWIGKTKKGRKR